MRDTQVGREPIRMSGPKGATGGTFVTRSTERTTLVTRQCDGGPSANDWPEAPAQRRVVELLPV